MRKRIFAAIEISEDARRRAAARIKFLRERFSHSRVSWDKPEKLHLTLKFFGDVEENEIAKIIEAAREAVKQVSPFEISIVGTGVFPSPSKPRVLWFGVEDDSGGFSEMHRIFENECVKRGFDAEQRKFKPHLTIARLKETNTELVKTHLAHSFEPATFTVSKIEIFQSILQREGSVYSLIESVS